MTESSLELVKPSLISKNEQHTGAHLKIPFHNRNAFGEMSFDHDRIKR